MTLTFTLRLLAMIGSWGGIVLPVAYQLFKGVNGYTPVTRAFFLASILMSWNLTRSLFYLQMITDQTILQAQYQLETSFYQFGVVMLLISVVWFQAKSNKGE